MASCSWCIGCPAYSRASGAARPPASPWPLRAQGVLVGEAFAWGFIAASSLLLGALIALRRPIGLHPLGLIMAFGSGVLISSVAYELVEDAFSTSSGSGAVGLGLLAGALTFYLGDIAIDRFGGDGRKSAAGGQDAGSGLAILFGTVLDGIPE